MRIKIRTVIAIFLLLVLGSGSFMLYRLLSRDPDKEALHSLIEKVVACVSVCEAEDYLQFVDLDEFGFRLEYWGNIHAFGKSEQDAFTQKAQEWTPILAGSEARIMKTDIEINIPTAAATITAHWKKGSARGFGPGSALIGCDFKFARGGNGWKISGVKIYPAREFLLRRQ